MNHSAIQPSSSPFLPAGELAGPGPISASERIGSIDVLRGVAVCGILVMNIPWFARSESMFFNPTKGGGFDGADYWTWFISHLFFDMKMMTIFSMLFGAGVLILTERAAASGRSAAAIYYRRLAWLLVFGLLHAYLLWHGDILYTYAMCGMLLYPVRRMRPVFLIVLGLILLFIGSAITMSSGWFFEFARTTAREAQAVIDSGGTPTETQRSMLEAWNDISADFVPGPDTLAEERNAHLGSYAEHLPYRARQAIFMQTGLFLMMLLWRGLGAMLLGMAMMKLNIFSAARSRGFYLGMMVIGYGVGLPVVGIGVNMMIESDFDFVLAFKHDWAFNYAGSLFVALGHIGLVMLICKSVGVNGITSALAAIGRMALTNYLMQSLLCALIFYGWGLGNFGSTSRFENVGVIVGIWIFQAAFSMLWLWHFRFGPMEWIWRTLTYWRVQPFLRN